MYHLIEQNERRGRQRAILMTLIIHLAIGIAAYWYATQPAESTSKPVKPAGIVSYQAGQIP
jgi:hypothetical protein